MAQFPFQFETMFWAVFILSTVFFILVFVVMIIRVIKSRGQVLMQTQTETTTPIVKEKEIIREIIKIRCPYCGTVYDENLEKCPNCGGKKT